MAAVRRKGFEVTVVDTEEEFIKGLLQEGEGREYHVAWLISSDAQDWYTQSTPRNLPLQKWRELTRACEIFHKSGRGLMIFADNEPFFDHANVVLQRLFNDDRIRLEGSTPPAKPNTDTMFLKSESQKSAFEMHLITTGLVTLYEGDTLCKCANRGPLKTLARSSFDTDALLYFDPSSRDLGRVVVDTAFTKLWLKWDTAGEKHSKRSRRKEVT
jgi:hypothetical protein